MTREMQDMGPFIVKKQCRDLFLDPDNLTVHDLPKLSKSLATVMTGFGGQVKAKEIYNELNQLKDVDEIVVEEEDSERKLEMLLDVGDTHFVMGEWEKALDYYNQLKEQGQNARRPIRVAEALRKTGHVLRDMGFYDKGMKNYREALAISERVDDPQGTADALRGIGCIHWRKGEYKHAKIAFEKTLKIAMPRQFTDILGSTYIDFGNLCAQTEDPEKGLEYYKDGIEELERIGNHSEIARAYNNIGDTYLLWGKWDEAIANFDLCRQHAEKDENKNLVAWAQFNKGEALAKKGVFDTSKECLDESMAIVRAMGDSEAVSAVYRNYGILYTLKEEWEKAEESFNKALSGFQNLDTPYDVAQTHYDLGIMYKGMQRSSDAAKHLRFAKAFFKKLGAKVEADNADSSLSSLEVK